MMDELTPEALAYLDRHPHAARYRQLLDASHPDYNPAYREVVEAKARGLPPPPPRPEPVPEPEPSSDPEEEKRRRRARKPRLALGQNQKRR